MANKNSTYINALTEFIKDTKPYRCKLTEVQEIYQFADNMTVNIKERVLTSVKTSAAWTYPYFSSGNQISSWSQTYTNADGPFPIVVSVPITIPPNTVLDSMTVTGPAIRIGNTLDITVTGPGTVSVIVELGVGYTLPFHQLVNPLSRGFSKNSDPLNTRGAFKAYRDENTDLPMVPLAFDPKCLQGVGLADAFIQRNGQKTLNEPILEGHDVFLSKGAYVVQIKQTVNSQALVIGRHDEVYEVTDGPFPLLVSLAFSNADSLVITGPAVQVTLNTISVTGPGHVVVSGLSSTPNYDAEFTERSNENLLAWVTSATQASALDVLNPASAVNQIRGILNAINAQLAITPNADASAALVPLFATLNTPALPSSYEALLTALVTGGTPVIAGYVGYVGQDTSVPYTDKYVDDALAALSPSLYFNAYTDLSGRETGTLHYNAMTQGVLTVHTISADAIRQNYEEYTLEAVSADSLLIRGSTSGPVGAITIPPHPGVASFSSVQLAFKAEFGAPGDVLTVGDIFKLTPAAKITVHHQAPLEAWSLIATNPIAYSRPAFTSTRYGYIRSSALVPNFVTVLDSAIPSCTITLTATSSTTFKLESSAEPYTVPSIPVNVPFNDGRLAFTIVQGSAYVFTVGDKFYIELQNNAPVAEDLDLFYGYDTDSFDADTLVYNTVSSALPNYLEQIGFGYDSRFIGYDLASFGLVLDGSVVSNVQWRLRALPDISLPLQLQNSAEPNLVSVIATDDPTNPNAAVQFLIPNDVTSEGAQSGTDPLQIGELRLYYSTSFELEYYDTNTNTWTSVDVVPVGVPYTNAVHGLSFTIVPAAKPFIASTLTGSYYLTPSGPEAVHSIDSGDIISWTIRNDAPVQLEAASLSSRLTPRLIMRGEGFHGVTPAKWTLSWISSTSYQIQGIHVGGPLNGFPVLPSPIVVSTSAEGLSYRNDEHHLHWTVVQGVAGLAPNDSFAFETYEREPTFLVHGSVSGWQPNAAIDEWYWNGKIGFKIARPTVRLFDQLTNTQVGTESPWTVPAGTITLNRLRADTPAATYVARSHADGHWTLYRNGELVSDGSTVLGDQYLELELPPALVGNAHTFLVSGHEFTLSQGNDLAIIRTSPGRSPSTNDFVLLERTEQDSLQISIKAKDASHQFVLNGLAPAVTDLRFVDHNANSGVPLSATSPETGILTGWLPTRQTFLDKSLSIAEFSDAATHVVVRAAATGETVGTVESLSSDPTYPVVFRWDPAFHAKYLPLNTEAAVISLGSGMDDRLNVTMRDSVKFLLSGGGLSDNMLFGDVMNVNITESPLQWSVLATYEEMVAAAMADGPFAGFLPGYDNTRFDFELGTGDVNSETDPSGYYDAGIPTTDDFLNAQALALLPSMSPAQQALYNDLISVLEPYLDGDVISTTLAEFTAAVNSAVPTNYTPSPYGFGVPAVGLGVSIQSTADENTSTTQFVESMTIIAVDSGYSIGNAGFDIGLMDEQAETTAVLFSTVLPPLPLTGLPAPLTTYNSFQTPLMVNSPGARVVELSFATALASTPNFYIWRPADPAPVVVPIVERLTSRRFRFTLPAAGELKLIVV